MKEKVLNDLIEKMEKTQEKLSKSQKEIVQSIKKDNNKRSKFLINNIDNPRLNLDNLKTKNEQIELFRYYAKIEPLLVIDLYRRLSKLHKINKVNNIIVLKELIIHCNDPFIIVFFRMKFQCFQPVRISQQEIEDNIGNEALFCNLINFFKIINMRKNLLLNKSEKEFIRYIDDNFYNRLNNIKNNLNKIHSNDFFQAYTTYTESLSLRFYDLIDKINNRDNDLIIKSGYFPFFSIKINKLQDLLQKKKINNINLLYLYLYNEKYFSASGTDPNFFLIEDLISENTGFSSKFINKVKSLNIDFSNSIINYLEDDSIQVQNQKKQINTKMDNKKIDKNLKSVLLMLESNNVLNKHSSEIIKLAHVYKSQIELINPKLFQHLDLIDSCIKSNPLKINNSKEILEKANDYFYYL